MEIFADQCVPADVIEAGLSKSSDEEIFNYILKNSQVKNKKINF